jgi:hypothetical protein
MGVGEQAKMFIPAHGRIILEIVVRLLMPCLYQQMFAKLNIFILATSE